MLHSLLWQTTQGGSPDKTEFANKHLNSQLANQKPCLLSSFSLAMGLMARLRLAKIKTMTRSVWYAIEAY